MWEFFLGVSLTCFFAVYWLKRGNQPKPRQREIVYAPSNEVLQYKTRKKSNDYTTVASYTSEEPKSRIPINDPAPSYRAPIAPETRQFTPEKDEFVEYAASIVTEEPEVTAPKPKELAQELPKSTPENTENEDDDEKKSKFSALRFFNS